MEPFGNAGLRDIGHGVGEPVTGAAPHPFQSPVPDDRHHNVTFLGEVVDAKLTRTARRKNDAFPGPYDRDEVNG